MRIALIARMDRSGLANQTKALYDLLMPSKTIVIDSTPFNHREQDTTLYPDGIINKGFITDEQARDYLKDVDVLISCEVFYNNNLPKIAREMGVKTILQPNAELNQFFVWHNLPKPDAFFLPSRYYEKETLRLRVRTFYCPPPITINPKYKNIDKQPGQLNVLHVAGRIAAKDRNGTEIVKKINLPGVNIHIHNQSVSDLKNVEDIYKGDYHVVLMPRRYGGLCLPMLESLSYGLPVIMPNIDPNDKVLPLEWLTVAQLNGYIRTKRVIDYYLPVQADIERKLIYFRDMDNRDYQEHRLKAKNIYKEYKSGWPKWKEYIDKVVNN